MSSYKFNQKLFDFLSYATTPFHAVAIGSELLRDAGFIQLFEEDNWKIDAGKSYFCIRDDGSLLGCKVASKKNSAAGWKMLGSHTDSPSLQLKPLPEKTVNGYTQLGVEVYGGPILSSWFDRDLGIAGRVSLQAPDDSLFQKRIDFGQPVAIIPNLAIHLNREVNKKYTIERQKHLFPLIWQSKDENFSLVDVLKSQVAKEYPEVEFDNLLGFDLFCYDTQKPEYIGFEKNFIAASRLDNLVSCFIGLMALLEDDTTGNCLLVCSNHEEIGSNTFAGAQGNFLSSTLTRLLPDTVKRARALSDSTFISMDNAHALHPNFIEKHDPQHLPLLNHGPVIKYNAAQRYATTSRSAALFKRAALQANIPIHEFVMQNDLSCGSTIGPITATTLGIQTVDVGIPSLAMHSIRETTGSDDPHMLFQVIKEFLSQPL